jgi:hypothetical protein
MEYSVQTLIKTKVSDKKKFKKKKVSYGLFLDWGLV